MLFNSIDYLLFFIAVFSIHYILPRKVRYLWLLGVSYFFYGHWNAKYTLLLLATTLVSYLAARIIERYRDNRRIKAVTLWGTFLSCFGLLVYFKYANFLISNINAFLSSLSAGEGISPLDVILPVGISFYTFQAVGYVIDVARGEIAAERNPFRYALFVSFFPQLVAGPIERSKNLLHQLARPSELTGGRLREGLIYLLIGLWQKVVVADNVALIVNRVFADYTAYPGFSLFGTAILFGIQIYCDFAGYSNMAIGSAKLFGVDLMNNFFAPYLATSVPDFWRRWHISLTSWLKDYLYIPLGGNRKGEIRKYVNVLIVFLVSGVWHGAEWNFIFWGFLNGVFIVIHNLKEKFLPSSTRPGIATVIRKRIITFSLISLTWIFFRISSLPDALDILGRIFFSTHTNHFIRMIRYATFPTMQIVSYIGIATSIAILVFIDVIKNRHGNFIAWLSTKGAMIRWGFYAVLVLEIILLGAYGGNYAQTKFIYFQF